MGSDLLVCLSSMINVDDGLSAFHGAVTEQMIAKYNDLDCVSARLKGGPKSVSAT